MKRIGLKRENRKIEHNKKELIYVSKNKRQELEIDAGISDNVTMFRASNATFILTESYEQNHAGIEFVDWENEFYTPAIHPEHFAFFTDVTEICKNYWNLPTIARCKELALWIAL